MKSLLQSKGLIITVTDKSGVVLEVGNRVQFDAFGSFSPSGRGVLVSIDLELQNVVIKADDERKNNEIRGPKQVLFVSATARIIPIDSKTVNKVRKVEENKATASQ